MPRKKKQIKRGKDAPTRKQMKKESRAKNRAAMVTRKGFNPTHC